MAEYDDQIIQAWQEAQEELKIEIEAPFAFQTPDGLSHSVLVLVKRFGSPMGTVVVSINDDFNIFLEMARAAGYYCSALNPSNYSKYSRKLFMETLDDWGWYGEEQARPEWYTGTTWGA